MAVDVDRARLSQDKTFESLRRDYQSTEMVTVYSSHTEDLRNGSIYAAVVPSGQIEQVLSDPSWDFSHGDGLPGAVEYRRDGKKQVEYLRFGVDDGIEPLVIDREFFGVRDRYTEICEEFRLFHRLYHDRRSDQYIKIDRDGNEHLVATVEVDRVQIRLKEIRQFLAIKEMHLSIQFDCLEYSDYSLQELTLKEGGSFQHDGLMCWGLHFGSFDVGRHRAFSRLQGVRLIPPLPKSKSGLWGFAEAAEKRYVDFIIDTDENGDEISYTSNPDSLANFFGANSDAPNYLTAVHFRKEVLDKYYQQPSKYSVEDSILRCGCLWSITIDNHHNNKVCAWLGDLGRDLSYEEQLHWRAHNILPKGGVSETYFKRQLLNQPTDSDRPEHVFKQRFQDLNKACDKWLGWQLLLPLEAGDEHHFQGIRVPATDEQHDFDQLVLGLTKVLIDSLNEKRLTKLIPTERRSDPKGSIARLEAALSACGIQDSADSITFLRKLQNLRSSSSAHRKGSNYRKIASEFGVESQSLREVFAGILLQAVSLLDYLLAAVCTGRMRKARQDPTD